jgi:hypothetical protein
MSEFYAEKNNESSFELFNKRTVYKGELLRSYQPNIVNFFEGEKILYGRISRRFIPLTVSPHILAPVAATSGDRPLQAVNFVAAVFQEMALQFKKCAQRGQIIDDDPHLTNLIAYKAYVSPRSQYLEYKTAYFAAIASKFREHNIKVTNFREFIYALFPIIRDALRQKPLTFPGFVKSTSCSILGSGLAIEIASMDYINDAQKVTELVQSPNWEFFVNTCNSYGFMVDYHVPWRIVADIGTDSMKEIARKYGLNHILDHGYGNAASLYLRGFLVDLRNLYNTVVEPVIVETETCKNGTTKRHVKRRTEYTVRQLAQSHDAYEFVKIYLQLRLYEEVPTMRQVDMDKVIREYLNITKKTASMRHISFAFESIINKTFDKRGSMSYLRRELIAQTRKGFAEGTIENVAISDMGMTYDDLSSY